jgi:Polysaccharide pyruvyl transferase
VALNDIPLGDPGFLAPALLGFARRRAPRSRLGIVCHYVDRRNPILQRMLAQDGVADLNVHAPPEEFLERMADCVAVASSSLHGLIFAEALGIPNLWLRAGNEIGGGDFKYLDWFTTTRHPQKAAHQLVIEDTAEALASRAELHDSMIDVHALAASFPYGQLDALRATAGTPILSAAACRKMPMPVFLDSPEMSTEDRQQPSQSCYYFRLETRGEIDLILNADELGKKGEARFSEICSDTKLVRNPSLDHDRTGWDYIVEFEQQPPSGSETLDTRRSPLSAHVQVKTMWNKNDRFRMRLSAAERLAKEPKPAFVYVFKVNNKLDFVSAHLVHILDDNLATILKRLRMEQAKGTKPYRINKKYISFKVSTSDRKIEPTGEALRLTISEFCGPDLNAYIDRKREQLQNLGFEPRRFQATTTFKVESMDGFVDGLLGLRELEVTDGRAFETRFGIKLSLNEPSFAKSVMRVEPGKADTCIVTVRETALTPPATFSADIILQRTCQKNT